jgi:membrane protease YdiL (CAAX protease family)
MDTTTLSQKHKKPQIHSEPNAKAHNVIFWLFLAGLLILRLPILSWLEYVIPASAAWVNPVYEIGTYLLIAALIWWEWERLADFHIDTLAVWMILLLRPLATVIMNAYGVSNPFAFLRPLSLPFFIIAISLVVLLTRQIIRPVRVTKNELVWVAASCGLGVLFADVVSILLVGLMHYPIPPFPGYIALISPLYQLGYAAVPEEPLFRGFLWGGLKKAGLKDLWILLIQAVLFMAGHTHLLNTKQALLNLSIVFLFALAAGIIAWRSRSIASSMAFHGFYNGSAIFLYWLETALFAYGAFQTGKCSGSS